MSARIQQEFDSELGGLVDEATDIAVAAKNSAVSAAMASGQIAGFHSTRLAFDAALPTAPPGIHQVDRDESAGGNRTRYTVSAGHVATFQLFVERPWGAGQRFSAPVAALLGGYPINAELVSDDGATRYISAVAANSNNPNLDPAGWVEADSYNPAVEPWAGGKRTSYRARLIETVSLAEAAGVTRLATRGTTDAPTRLANAAGLQSALNHLYKYGGGKLIIPDGYWDMSGLAEFSERLQAPAPGYEGLHYDDVTLEIEGIGRATLIQNHATQPLLRIQGRPFGMSARVSGLRLWGRGRYTAGNLLESINLASLTLNDLQFNGTGGNGWFCVTSERVQTNGLRFENCRQPYRQIGASNETQHFNRRIISAGFTVDPVLGAIDSRQHFGVNRQGDGIGVNAITKTSGNTYQDKHPAVEIRGPQIYTIDGASTKPTGLIGGTRYRGCENVIDQSQYYEGYAQGPNWSIAVIGAAESTSIAATIGINDGAAVVADALWFAERFSDNFTLDAVTSPSPGFGIEALYAIYEPATPTVYEEVMIKGFVGNVVYFKERGRLGNGGVSQRAWPVGSVITEFFRAGNNNNSQVWVVNGHLESSSNIPPGTTFVGGDAAAAAAGYTCGENVIGIVPDAFHEAIRLTYPSQGSANVRYSCPITRTYPLPGGGKVQMCKNAYAYFDEPGNRSDRVFGMQDDVALSGFCNWVYADPNTYYTNIGGPSFAPLGWGITKSTDTVLLPAPTHGAPTYLSGYRGAGITKESLRNSFAHLVDDANGIPLSGVRYSHAASDVQPVLSPVFSGGVITSITVVFGGHRVPPAGSISITGNGTGATAVPVFDAAGVLIAVTVTNGGSGYTSAAAAYVPAGTAQVSRGPSLGLGGVYYGVAIDCHGYGSPEGRLARGPGSIYRNLAGGASTAIWVKQTGTGNTGWAAK